MDSTTSTSELPELAASPTLLFRVGDGVYGCDIAEAQEIIPLRPMTRLPGAPRYVRGLINLRGTIVTVIDLGMRLEASRGPSAGGSIVLVRYHDRLVGLVVDEVADVRVLDAEAHGGAVAGGAGPGDAIVRGMAPIESDAGAAKDEHAVAVILDLEALIKHVLLA